MSDIFVLLMVLGNWLLSARHLATIFMTFTPLAICTAIGLALRFTKENTL